MDYRKIDAALAAALADIQSPDDPAFEVFVHADHPPGPEDLAFLQNLGVRAETGGMIFTARLSAKAVDLLSNEHWVRQIRLTRRLRPLF